MLKKLVSVHLFCKDELTLRQEARERRIISNVKPFIETLRVTNPVRQSQASSRKRSLRGERRLSLRSVDSEIKRCAIEPRNLAIVESPRFGRTRGPRRADYAWSQRLCSVSPGSKNMANDHQGSTGTWETLTSPSSMAGGSPVDQLQDDPQSGPRLWGRTGDETMVSPSEGNEVRRNERQGVAVPHSTVEPGEPT